MAPELRTFTSDVRVKGRLFVDGTILPGLTGFGWVNVKWYGAKGDGATNDTAAIQAAITAAQPNSEVVYFPSGNYLLKGTGTELLLVSKDVSLVGESMDGVQLLIDASVPATTDVIRLHPAAGVSFRNFVFENFRIISNVYPTAAGRHGIVVDTTDAAINNATFRKLDIRMGAGKAVFTVNPSLTDGYFLSVWEECILQGGVKLQRAGDSITFRACTINGANIGIDADFVTGATEFVISENNFTTTTTAIKVSKCALVAIVNNNIEATAGAAYPGVPLIDLPGDSGDQLTPYVVGNTLGAIVANGDVVHLDYAFGGYLGGNRIACSGTGIGFTTTAHTRNVVIDVDSNHWVGIPAAKVSDPGVSTVAARKPLQILARGAAVQFGPLTTLTYGVTVAVDASLSNWFQVTPNDGVAFTISNPTNGSDGQFLTLTVRNGAGAPLGAVTWDTSYRLAAWVSPAAGQTRSITFKFIVASSLWAEVSRTPADVPF